MAKKKVKKIKIVDEDTIKKSMSSLYKALSKDPASRLPEGGVYLSEGMVLMPNGEIKEQE